MKKVILLLLALLAVFLGLLLAWRSVQTPAPEGADSILPADRTVPPVPSMPFVPADLQPGERVSPASIERMEARAEELREAAAQLEIKMESIDKRLAAPADAAQQAALQEAKQTLTIDLQKMRLEEKAMAEFLRNELKED